MSTVGRSEDAPDRVAAAVRDAGFVRLVATADGDALAATGLLARALRATDVPYQASLAAVPEVPPTDADCTVAIGHATGDVTLRSEPLSVAAYDVAAALGQDGDATLALAGAVCARETPSGELLEAADLDRRPGVALPTADRTDLAWSTLVHASFSGDERATRATLAELDAEDGRTFASFLAVTAVIDAPPRAATAVERALYPYVTGRFETLGGYADVLSAVAHEAPGTGIALALGNDVDAAALELWRAHGKRAHVGLRSADTERYGGLFVANVDDETPLTTVARLLYSYRSPESTALAVTDGEAAVVSEKPVGDALGNAAAALDGRAVARETHGRASFDGEASEFVTAFREART